MTCQKAGLPFIFFHSYAIIFYFLLDLSPSQTGGQGTQAKFKGHGDAKKSNLLNEQTELHGNMAGHKSSPKSPSIVIDGGDTQRY